MSKWDSTVDECVAAVVGPLGDDAVRSSRGRDLQARPPGTVVEARERAADEPGEDEMLGKPRLVCQESGFHRDRCAQSGLDRL